MAGTRLIAVMMILLLAINTATAAVAASESTEHKQVEEVDEELEDLDDDLDDDLDEEVSDDERAKAQAVSKAQRIVADLNDDNAKYFVSSKKYVFVVVYAPWCSRSSDLMPEFAAAANAFQEIDSGIAFAKLDGDRYPKAAAKIGASGFPSVILFVNGTAHPYNGGFSSDDMVIWLRKKSGRLTMRLSSVDDTKEYLKKNWTTVVGLFKSFEGIAYDEFFKAAAEENHVQFLEVSSIEVAQLFGDAMKFPYSLSLVKREPENFVLYDGEFKKDSILQFIEENKYPLVTKITEQNSVSMLGRPIKYQVFLFATSDEYWTILPLYQDVAKKYKSKIMFLYYDSTNDDLAKPMLTLYGLEASQPIITAFDNSNGAKFLLESDINARNLEEFCSGLVGGNLLPYYKSQPIPAESKGDVRVVVGKNFDEVVLNSPEDILLEVSTTWCAQCKVVGKLIAKVARHFKGTSSLIVAKIDASENEHPSIQVDNYPVLLFYPGGQKNNPIKVSTKSSLSDLINFVTEHASTPIVQVKSTKEEEFSSTSTDSESKSEL